MPGKQQPLELPLAPQSPLPGSKPTPRATRKAKTMQPIVVEAPCGSLYAGLPKGLARLEASLLQASSRRATAGGDADDLSDSEVASSPPTRDLMEVFECRCI